MDGYSMEQILNIGLIDSLQRVLFRHHFAVQQRNTNQIRQAVVSFFFRAHESLISLVSSTNDVVSDIEGLNVDMLYLYRIEPLLCPQLQAAFDSCLGVNFRIVFL